MNMTLQINIGVTPALERLLWGLIGATAKAVEPTPEDKLAEAVQKLNEQTHPCYVDPLPFDMEPQQPENQTSQAETADVAEPMPLDPMPEEAAPQAPQQAPQQAPVYDKEWLLEVMHRTRQRIQGEDYKNDSSAKTKALHKALSGEFRRIAIELGASIGVKAEKPSDLPETDIRVAFMRSCEELYLDDDGTIKVKEPF